MTIKLCIWESDFPVPVDVRDTAGQERFRTLTSAYFRGAMVYFSNLLNCICIWIDTVFNFQLTISRKQGQKVKLMVSSKKAFKTLYKRSSLKKSHSRTLTAFINDHHSDSFNIKIIVVAWLKNWPQLFKRWITYRDIYLYM